MHDIDPPRRLRRAPVVVAVAVIALVAGCSAVVVAFAGAAPVPSLQHAIAIGPTVPPTTRPSHPAVVPPGTQIAPRRPAGGRVPAATAPQQPESTTRVVVVPKVTVEDDFGNPTDPRGDDRAGGPGTTTTVASRDS